MNTAFDKPEAPPTIVTSLIVNVGVPSSLRIVAVAGVCTVPTGPEIADRLTTKVSFDSVVVSPLTATVINAVVWPGAKVKVPLVPT